MSASDNPNIDHQELAVLFEAVSKFRFKLNQKIEQNDVLYAAFDEKCIKASTTLIREYNYLETVIDQEYSKLCEDIENAETVEQQKQMFISGISEQIQFTDIFLRVVNGSDGEGSPVILADPDIQKLIPPNIKTPEMALLCSKINATEIAKLTQATPALLH